MSKVNGPAVWLPAMAKLLPARAQDEGRKVADVPAQAPAPKADSGYDAGGAAAAKRYQLLGGQPGGTPVERARMDARKIALAANLHPSHAAVQLEAQLRASPDPAYRLALLEAAAPQLRAVGKALSQPPTRGLVDGVHSDLAFRALSRAAALGGEAGTRLIARELASAFPARVLSRDVPLGLAMEPFWMQGGASSRIKSALRSGEGYGLAGALVTHLHATGRSSTADAVAHATAAALGTLRKDFAAKGKKVDALHANLARLVAGFSPLLSAQQRQAGIEAFTARHQKDFAAWEASGARLAAALGASAELSRGVRAHSLGNTDGAKALRAQAQAALKDLPRIAQTPAGEAALLRALSEQQQGRSSLMDLVPELLKKGSGGAKFAGDLANVVVKAVGSRALDLVKSGRINEADKLLLSLERNAALFGTAPADFRKVSSAMRAVAHGEPDAIRRLDSSLRELEGSTPFFRANSRGGQALKGLALGLAVAANIDGWRGLTEAQVTAQVRLIGDALGVGVDGGTLAIDVLGKADKLASVMKGLKLGSGALGAMGAVLDGITAMKAFQDGRYAEGIASSASAVGGAILATATFSAAAGVQVIPVAGQAIGALLVVGGLVGQYVLGRREANRAERADEADARAFLQGAGLSASAAAELSDLRQKDRRNVGPFISQIAGEVGMTAPQLLRHLESLPRKKLDRFVDMVKEMSTGKAGDYHRTHGSDEAYFALKDAGPMMNVEVAPNSLRAAADWMRRHGIVPR